MANRRICRCFSRHLLQKPPLPIALRQGMAKGRIITVTELAQYLGIHRITVYRLAAARKLPGFKIGRVWRFDLDEVEAWIEAGKCLRRSGDDGRRKKRRRARKGTKPAGKKR